MRRPPERGARVSLFRPHPSQRFAVIHLPQRGRLSGVWLPLPSALPVAALPKEKAMPLRKNGNDGRPLPSCASRNPPSPEGKAFGRAATSSDTPAGSLIREHTEASYVFREVRPVHLQTGRPAMTYNDVLRTMSLRGNRAGSAIPVAIRFLTTDQSPWQSALLIMDQSPRNPFSIYSTTSPWVSAPPFSIPNSIDTPSLPGYNGIDPIQFH